MLDRPHAFGGGKSIRKRQPGFFSHRAVALKRRLLGEISDPSASRNGDGSGRGVFDTGNDAENGRLAGTVHADERNVLAFRDLEPDPGKDLVRAVGLAKAVDGHDCRFSHSE
jgi:hypothetical protein